MDPEAIDRPITGFHFIKPVARAPWEADQLEATRYLNIEHLKERKKEALRAVAA